MPRIRSLKPEFWSSPGIETISPWARLLFAAMWNWADDDGRGTCNLRELQAFAFPNDPEDSIVGSSDGFRHVLSEVRGQFGVIFYKVNGRPYYEVPSFDRHQRTERKATGRHPRSDEGVPWDFMAVTSSAPEPPTPSGTESRKASEAPTSSGLGTGEQGNRGTGEQGSSSAERRRDVDQLCEHLADRMVRNGCKRPTITRKWRDAARLLLDADGREPDKATALIDWCQQDGFWRRNILSMPKFREKYDQLRLAALADWERTSRPSPRRHNADDTIRELLAPTGTDAVVLQLPTGGQP